MNLIEELLWYIKSDVEIKYETCWYGRENKIEGFKFYSKKPFSRSYQYHATIGLDNTYKILKMIQDTRKEKMRALMLQVGRGMGYEKVYIWKGSLDKAEKLIFNMIKKIQEQY